jgi:glycosyltransferase involved in cell wall biosynthesis
VHTESYQVAIVTETLPPNYGGADIAGYRYFRFLSQLGKQPYLLGMKNMQVVAEAAILPISTITLPKSIIRWGGVYIRFFWLWLQVLFFLLRHPRLKIIHCFNGSSWLIQAAVLAASVCGRKVIIETCLLGSDDPISVLKKRGLFSRVFRGKWIRKMAYLSADVYVAKSAYLFNTFVGTPIDANRVYTIPYAVDLKRFNPPQPAEKIALRQKLGLPENSFVICFSGGINQRKGVHLLVNAFKHIASHRQDVYLVLVGPHEKYDSGFVQEISNTVLTLPNHACLTGMVPNPEDWMRASDIFVLPTYREGFPISVLEALCCGLCVVASDIPEIKDVQIKNGVNGFLFKTGSVDDLQAVLEKVLILLERQEVDLRQIHSEASRSYDMVGIEQAYHTLYNGLVMQQKIRTGVAVENN